MTAQLLSLPVLDPPNDIAACVQSLNTGVAMADARTWSIVFETATFQDWCPPAGGRQDDGSLSGRLAGLDAERARARLDQGRPFRLEREVRTGARRSTLAI